MKLLTALISGILFGLGLALSGMTDTAKVQGFLDVFGAWDYSLALVMVGGLLVTFPAYQMVKRRTPFFERQFYLPDNTNVDLRLLLGAAIFGAGWGLYGFCPGPAIASIAYGNAEPIGFVGAMLAGMWAADQGASVLDNRVDNT